jgi:glutamate-ammonia-ligase adenylyltransferase
MIDDRQTHSLPKDPEALDCGRPAARPRGGRGPARLLEPHAERVAAIYGTLEGGEGRDLPNDSDALEASLGEAGFADAAAARARIEGWRSGRNPLAQDAGRA